MIKLLIKRLKLYKLYKKDAAYMKKHKSVNKLYKLRIKLIEQELFTKEQKYFYNSSLFIFCKCGNELLSSGSFDKEENGNFYFKCSRCRRVSAFRYDIAPVPISIEMEE